MQRINKFEALFDSMTESRAASLELRNKVTEGALELNKAKKIYLAKEKALAEGKIEVTCMTVSNRELRASMVMSLIERDELEAKKKALQQKLQKMKEDIDGLDNQSDFVLRSVEASCQPQQRNKS